MSKRLSGRMIAMAIGAAIVALSSALASRTAPVFGFVGVAAAAPAGAQAPQASGACPENLPARFHPCAKERSKAFGPPRTSDAKPDMQGFWGSSVGGFDNLEEHPRSPDMGAGPSLVVDPLDGKVPYQPWAAALLKENMAKYIEPNMACFPSGTPRSIYTPGGFQIRQSPGYVVFVFDRAHNYRIIPTDGRPHLSESLRLWQGDSRGRWDGNTLVVDTVNQNGKTWLDQMGRFNTEALHVVERFTLVDADTIHYEAVIEDPNVYTRPWTMAFPVRRNRRIAGFDFVEFACFEGEENVDMALGLGYRIFPGIRPRPAR